MSEYIEREAAKLLIFEYGVKHRDNANIASACENLERQISAIPAADVRPVPEGGIGEMSDGYHTFNGLYYQRMVLFAALVKAYNSKAWKSWKHEDGEPCFGGGWFIVGIDTPEGSYTYHYEDKDWDLFDCTELPVAKHWDGHTEEDVTRLMSLDVQPVVLCRDCLHYEMGACLKIYDDGAANKDAWQERKPDDFCSYGEDRNVPTNCRADMRPTSMSGANGEGKHEKRWSSTTPMCSRSATIKMPPDGFCSFGVKREES